MTEVNKTELTGFDKQVETELRSFDEMLKNPNCEHRNIMEQVYRILTLFGHITGKREKKYALKLEPELYITVQKSKKTYNSKTVLAFTIAAGALSIAGGIIGIASPFPSKGIADALGKIGPGVNAVGQGTGSLTSIFSNKIEGERVVINFNIEEIKKKRSDGQESSRQAHQQEREALNSCRQAAQEYHTTAMRMFSQTV